MPDTERHYLGRDLEQTPPPRWHVWETCRREGCGLRFFRRASEEWRVYCPTCMRLMWELCYVRKAKDASYRDPS